MGAGSGKYMSGSGPELGVGGRLITVVLEREIEESGLQKWKAGVRTVEFAAMALFPSECRS